MDDLDVSPLRTLQAGPPAPRFVESDEILARAFVQPVLRFMRTEAASGILMIIAAVVAVAWANSPLSTAYFGFFDAHVEIAFGDVHLHHLSDMTVREWVNDALMTLFFFVVGLEIKRELVVGELNTRRKAALPAVAALGGMLVPASIYVLLNLGEPSVDGWGVPMATDIAFAAGVIALVGKRVPLSAKLFLLALAIVDDLGAILVIAVVYVQEPAFTWLLPAALGLVVIREFQRHRVRAVPVYVVVGSIVWLCVLESGVHATVAGVVIAFMTPLSSYNSPRRFPERARELAGRIGRYVPDDANDLRELDHHTQARIEHHMSALRDLTRDSVPPLTRLENALMPWTSYVVVPLFALANAGVVLSGETLAAAPTEPVFLGVALGLLVGKVVGVFGFTWLAVRLGIGDLPRGLTWSHVVGIAMLAAIGFTVALFVSALAYADPALDDQAKIGVFAASIVAGLAGWAWLRFVAPDPRGEDPDPAQDRDATPRPGATVVAA